MAPTTVPPLPLQAVESLTASVPRVRAFLDGVDPDAERRERRPEETGGVDGECARSVRDHRRDTLRQALRDV
jgi:hypothetical protein